MRLLRMVSVAIGLGLAASAAAQPRPSIPVLVPLTGFLALEGTSQRNGAVLALEEGAPALGIDFAVTDTATAPEQAVTAFERALGRGRVVAAVAPILGTQMLALLPVAREARVPLVTVSGTAQITELGNPYVFRFFPGDAVVKRAHARYAVEELHLRRPAVLYQTTAYGQSGRQHLRDALTALGAPPVLEEPLDVEVKDTLPALAKARAAGADGLLLHLHAASTALVVRQAVGMGLGLPIVAGSALHQPATAALLEPAELKGVCAETGAAPAAAEDTATRDFVRRYRARFADEPDAYALQQYDAVKMVLAAFAAGARDGDAMRDALARGRHAGLAMTYKSDGAGNMAHDAVVICYDGSGRTARIVKRYPAAG